MNLVKVELKLGFDITFPLYIRPNTKQHPSIFGGRGGSHVLQKRASVSTIVLRMSLRRFVTYYFCSYSVSKMWYILCTSVIDVVHAPDKYGRSAAYNK